MSPVEQFFAVFASANKAIWPIQVLWYAAALGAIILACRPSPRSGRLVGIFLATYYVWMGIVFFWIFYSPLDKAAGFDGAMFILQGVLFLTAGVIRSDLVFRPRWNAYSMVGGMAILYSLVIYPILGALSGHFFPAAPIFSIAPCPTAIFTVGLLLWTEGRLPKYLLFVPFAWSLAAWPGAISMGVVEDLALPVVGLVGAFLIIWRDRTSLMRALSIALVLAAMVFASGHDDLLLGASLVFIVITLVQQLVGRYSIAPNRVSPSLLGPRNQR